MDRRLLFGLAVLVALAVLALMGLTPPVLWARAQDFVANMSGAATATRTQSDRREMRDKEVGAVIDSMNNKADENKPVPRPQRPHP